MKTSIVATLIIFVGLSSLADASKTINSSTLTLSPSSIDKVIRLVDKDQSGSSHKKLSIIVTDRGMSTDVSPRYTVFLGYASLAEMGNISADFEINNQAYKFISASRKSAGVYQIKTLEYRDEGMFEVTQTINATKIFSDENKLRKNCGGDFCDETLKTSISISEIAKKAE